MAEKTEVLEAASVDEKSRDAIQSVIEKEFNVPDEEYRKLRYAAMENLEDVADQEEFAVYKETPVYKAYADYMEKTYASYFTENGYANFLNINPAFMYSIYEGSYKLSASDIKINASENEPTVYNFSFQVAHQDESSASSRYKFEGKAIVPEEGKIEEIEFLDKEGLKQKLNKANVN
ncbi:MAG TPA: hypothetical protein VLQ20_10215 [Planococcus sp. (in: firmicutes)]|nr:hypothetical protein [Planococcus sp. (in: firmicutes)]